MFTVEKTSKEITAQEARLTYQKHIDSQNEDKLDQIFDMIRDVCTECPNLKISTDLVNNFVTDRLTKLGYVLKHAPAHDRNADDIYVISWENANVNS